MNSNNKGIIVGSGTVSAKIIAVGDGAEVNHINVEGFDSLTKDDILHLFMELKKILEEAELPEDTKTMWFARLTYSLEQIEYFTG